MANSFIGVDEPATIDLKVDTEQVVVGANTVQRERIQVAGATDTAIAVVSAANGLQVDVTRIAAGTTNIGDVDVLTIAAGDNNIGNVDVVTQPARSHATDSVRVGDGTDLALVTVAGELNVLASAQPGVDIGDVTVNNAAGASAVNIQDGGNAITVDGTVTANQGTPAATANRWPVQITDGTDLALVTAAGAVVVDGSAVTQPVSGTVTAAQATASSLNAEVQGDAAHDAAATGNPVLAGAQMETMADAAPGTRSSADGDATKLATTDGALFTIPTGPQTWSYHENSSAALTDTSVHAAPGVGLSLYVTSIVFSTGAATAWNIFFEEGAATVLGPWYLEAVAGRGANIYLAAPKKITANTALTVTTSAAIAHSIDVTGFVAPG